VSRIATQCIMAVNSSAEAKTSASPRQPKEAGYVYFFLLFFCSCCDFLLTHRGYLQCWFSHSSVASSTLRALLALPTWISEFWNQLLQVLRPCAESIYFSVDTHDMLALLCSLLLRSVATQYKCSLVTSFLSVASSTTWWRPSRWVDLSRFRYSQNSSMCCHYIVGPSI
jgi:hypothetical protein